MALPLLGLAIPFLTDLVSTYGEKLVVSGVEKICNIDLSKEELTPEDKQIILDNEYKLKELDFKKLELSLEEKKEDNRASEAVASEVNKNTADARSMNLGIQTSAEASPLAKNTAYYIDITLVVSTIILAFFLFVFPLPLENKELAYMMFGSLLTLTGTVVNFHRGSSQSSSNKQDELNKLKRG